MGHRPPAATDDDVGTMTVGVEEEYLVLDTASGLPVPQGAEPARRLGDRLGDAVQTELQRACARAVGRPGPPGGAGRRHRAAGTGAARQRAAHGRRGQHADVVELIVAETLAV